MPRNISLFFKVHDAELAFQQGGPHVSKVKGEVFVEESGVRILASVLMVMALWRSVRKRA